jgi:hypothetical protein
MCGERIVLLLPPRGVDRQASSLRAIPRSVRPEPVEGFPSFSGGGAEEREGFDKLSPDGVWGTGCAAPNRPDGPDGEQALSVPSPSPSGLSLSKASLLLFRQWSRRREGFDKLSPDGVWGTDCAPSSRPEGPNGKHARSVPSPSPSGLSLSKASLLFPGDGAEEGRASTSSARTGFGGPIVLPPPAPRGRTASTLAPCHPSLRPA